MIWNNLLGEAAGFVAAIASARILFFGIHE
jgi:hypothetical protein